MSRFKRHLPNLLSAYRIAAVPLLLVFFFIGGETATWINVIIYAVACITDYMDGVIARSTGQTSVFGKFLDATSDKILIGGVLMMLVAFGRLEGLWLVPALIILLREIFISGLREFLGQYNISVPISHMGKWKTTTQMLSCGFLIAGPYGDQLIPYSVELGHALFLAAALITAVSGWNYLSAGIDTLRRLDAEGKK